MGCSHSSMASLAGGGADISHASSDYYKFASNIWRKALARMTPGHTSRSGAPAWASSSYTSWQPWGGKSHALVLQCDYDSEDLPLPLNFTNGASASSRMLKGMPAPLLEALSTEALTQNEHRWRINGCVRRRRSAGANADVAAFRRRGDQPRPEWETFVSMVEGKKYPVYSMQAHPEKSNFEWTTKEKLPSPQSACSGNEPVVCDVFVEKPAAADEAEERHRRAHLQVQPDTQGPPEGTSSRCTRSACDQIISSGQLYGGGCGMS